MSNVESTKKISEIMMLPLAAKALNVAAELGLADLLKESALDINELAVACNADKTVLLNMLKVIELFGFFDIEDDRMISNNTHSMLLVSDHPQSMQHFCRLFGEEYYRAYEGLIYTCKTGNSGLKHIYGETLYQYLKSTPSRSSVYDLAMRDFSRPVGAELARVFPDTFRFAGSLIDIGGGSGVITTELLHRYEHLSGCIFDREEVCEQSWRYLPSDIHDRVEVCCGDFFDSIPSGYDIYLLKNILHNWNMQSCKKILDTVSQSLEYNRLLIIEPLVEDGERSPRLQFNALFQSVICEDGTHQRNLNDMEKLLTKSNLRVARSAKLTTGHTVMKG
ncbi:methyltransferase [Vibrio sp. Vb339]|uniref:methyltransferase n=1 Tax=Vibrio sp. Vb339 TaxID=1192013 RepID=UPI0015569029|nr:methyltransferase [Vibrio sp. Vb339]